MYRGAVFFSFLMVSTPALTQPAPDIQLDPAIDCWYHSDFPMLKAVVDPREEIVSSRLYFRCSLYQDYYFVDLETEDALFTAVAPQAEESCPRVHYYVEAVTRDFTSARTPERVAEVASANECRRRDPGGLYLPGTEDPEIVLGATVAGTNLAPGFKGVGVSAFISSTGAVIASGSTSGASTAVIVAGVAAGGAAATAGVLVVSSSSDPPAPAPVVTPPAAVVTPPPVGTAPPPPAPAPDVKACVRFDPVNAVVDAGEPLVIDARCSEGGDALNFSIDLGDGRVKDGQGFVTVVYNTPGTYRMVITVSRAATTFAGAGFVDEDVIERTVRVNPKFEPPVPDFNGYHGGRDSCHGEFNASSSRGDIESYQWELDLDNAFGEGVITARGVIVQHDWGASSGCSVAKGILRARLTLVGKDGSRVSVTKIVNVFSSRPLETDRLMLRTSVATQLMTDERVVASVVLPGGITQPSSTRTPTLHAFAGKPGRNVLEGVLTTPASPTFWRFDFSASAHFVPGSLRVVAGVVASRDGRAVVLRLSGRPGERVRIEYELRK